ncbi:MAG: hypothetical protein D6744_00425 [Planctomycetota bacterium]|nr:MAG: hypothetical protein D6744_00425 [Planctomycetota bacterium]
MHFAVAPPAGEPPPRPPDRPAIVEHSPRPRQCASRSARRFDVWRRPPYWLSAISRSGAVPVQRLGEWFAAITRRILPDPMVIACLLTFLAAALAIAFPQTAALRDQALAARGLTVARIWFDGVWSPGFLTFALQMCIVLLAGFGLAQAPAAMRFLRWLASGVHNDRGAVLLVAIVSCVGCWVNWGFGLIAAGVLATKVRANLERIGRPANYALIVAAAYAGMMIWHGGLSGSAPLKVAKDGVELPAATTDAAGERIAPLTVAHTLLAPPNLILTAAVWIGIPLVLASMAGGRETSKEEAGRSQPEAGERKHGTSDEEQSHGRGDMQRKPSIADRINEARWVSLTLAAGFVIVLISLLRENGAAAINLNFVNALFLALGLALHRNLREYVTAVAEGGHAVTGIILQFPLYAGIQGIMFGAGLAAAMSQGFVDAAAWCAEAWRLPPSETFPIATLLSAGLVNFFVPSGGGQWIVQGPIMCDAAQHLGVSIEQTVMAVAYGDQWTNMAQPFWAIPLMGMTGVNIRRFMGYCTLLMLLALPVFAAALLLYS